MRRRLLLVLSALALVAVAGFALPLLGSTAGERTREFVLTRTADLDRFAALAQQASASGAARGNAELLAREVDSYVRLYGEGVLVVDGTGRPVAVSGVDPDDPAVAAAVDAALRNQPVAQPTLLGPWSNEPLLLGRPVGTGTWLGGAVVLRASPAAAAEDIAVAWAAVLAGAVAAAAAVAALALALARWVLRPVGRLADAVRAVAAGHPGDPVSPDTGPPELRELVGEFNRMADAVATSAEQQHRLVADTSHQLRNPLTALRLRLDTLDPHVADPGRAGYVSTLAEVERLESLLDDLLVLAAVESAVTERAAAGGRSASTEPADVGATVADRVDAWGPLADDAGVRLVLDPGPATAVGCPPSELAQALDVPLDNAIKYSGRGASVRIGWIVADRRVRIAVADDGPGLPAELYPKATRRFWRAPGQPQPGSGLGLAIAERLVGGRDGRLGVGPAGERGLIVTLELPCA